MPATSNPDLAKPCPHTEDMLRRYELLARHTRDKVLFLRYNDGRILEANDAACTGYGYSRNELLEMTIFDLRAPGTETNVQEQMLQADEEGVLFETVHRRKDGTTFPVEVSSQGATIGGVRTLISVVRNIEERKQAEAKLRESEARVRLKLDSILLPEGDLGVLDLRDILNVEAIQSLMDEFHTLTRMPMSIIDLKGNVLVGVGWQEICTRFHRVHPETSRNCFESDIELSRQITPGTFKIYRCKNNMWDVATPLIIGGKQMGSLFMGQFFFDDESVDESLFRQQAARYGFDEEQYMLALHSVPRLSREDLDACMAFFLKLADFLSKLSHGNLKLARSLAERDTLMSSLQKTSMRMKLLADSAGQLLGTSSPQEIVDSLCRNVMEFLDCQVFFNFLVDEQQGKLHLNACAGIPESAVETIQWLDYGVAICGCAARDACRIVAENIPDTPDPRTELVKSFGILAYACHPLLAHDRVLGTLSFGTRTRTSFTEQELQLMKAVADQVSIAIERKRVEEELREAKEAAESASLAKSQFLANMSHELRTPMSGVLGSIELALRSPLTGQQKELLEMAFSSGKSLLRILNDILDLSRIEAGKLEINTEPFILVDCVTEAVQMISPEARRKGLNLLHSFADGASGVWIGDHLRLRQVLINLIGNAVKFTEAGKVEVRVEVSGSDADGASPMRFTVSDSGIGIPEDKKHLLFKSFSQIDSTDTRIYGGTGLGLAISREIVERMGGTISFTSELGKGSVFFFTLPLQRVANESLRDERVTAENESSPFDMAHARILVADDDVIGRKLLTHALKSLDCSIDVATDGVSAVEMWEAKPYDMIIMDVQMPRMDGLTVARTIREKEAVRGGHTLILAMTAHAHPEFEQKCLAAGMDAYLSKPFEMQNGTAVVRRLMQSGNTR